MSKEIILSGMRPTGRLHLGNYLGALRNWVELQEKYRCYFFIADWHALMSDYDDPASITRNCRDMLCVWLAVGLDPSECVIFRQSDVPEHLELFFIFSTITPLGWLQRCPTYKEALVNVDKKDIRNYAFLGYPTLQAADIALYRADRVPVGKDQLPHLELTREVIRRFNHLYDTDAMVEPGELLTKVQKLKGIDSRKMSKSFGNTIHLTEEEKDLKNKINQMVTDPARIRVDDKGHPEVCSVFTYHKIFNCEEAKEIEKGCRSGAIGCVECKKKLYSKLNEFINPIREKYHYYMENPKKVNKILEEGNRRAQKAAARNLKLFRQEMNYG
ncbi:MAG: tryptophan--tRNA ligase [Elusimicrobiota bacterium]|nr:tryptophan--tRNA ligase [Elusimicrobiota bacterium]